MLTNGKRFFIVPLFALALAPTLATAESVGINFCERFQTVLDNQLLEDLELGEFQYFVDLLQPNNADINGTVYVNTSTIRVPNVTGLTEEQAIGVMQAWNLTVVDSFETPHPSVPAGVVIRTDPEQGKKVIPGHDVRLRVSTGPGTEETPSTDIPRVEFLGDIQGNGIKDVANEFGVLQTILNDATFDNGILTHQAVYDAWTANMTQFGTDLGPLADTVLQNMIPGIKEVFVAYLTLRDGGYAIESKPVAGEFHGYLSGGDEPTPNPSTAIGKVDITVTIDGDGNPTGATFHIEHDVANPVQVALWMKGTPDTLVIDFGGPSGSFDYTLTEDEFYIFDWTEVIGDSSAWEQYYINVTSTDYPEGEIRGEIDDFEPAPFIATGTGSFGIIAGMIALLNDLIVGELGFGLENPELQIDTYTGLEALLPDSDVDGDGASNRCEWEWFPPATCPDIVFECAPDLNGANEVPPNASTKTGTSKIRMWLDQDSGDTYLTMSIKHDISASKLVSAGIYAGGPGETGALLYQFPSAASPIEDVLLPEVFQSFGGPVYINILTTDYPDGEIRADTTECGGGGGKEWLTVEKPAAVKSGPFYPEAALDESIYPDYCTALEGCEITLLPGNEVPPVDSAAAGTLLSDALWYIEEQANGVHLYIEHDVQNPVSVGIYAGGPGETGDLVIDLGSSASPIDTVLPPDIVALLDPMTQYYVNITSTDFPAGEIRGQYDCKAAIRLLHASPDAPAVSLCMAGLPVFSDAVYGVISEPTDVPAQYYDFNVILATGTCGDEPLVALDGQLFGGASYTLAVTDFAADVSYLMLQNAVNPTPEGKVKVRFMHLSPTRMLVNLSLDGTPLFENAAYQQDAGYYTVDPGVYDLTVDSVTKETLVTQPDVELLPGGAYSLYFIGLGSGAPDPALLVVVDVEGSALEGEGEGNPEGEGEGSQGCPEPNCDGPLTFTDAAVEAIVRAGIEKPTGDIQPADVAEYIAFNGRQGGILELCGVECLTALTYFNASLNFDLSDISPLAALPNLETIDLSVCPVSDISALEGLLNLSEVRIIDTGVTDLSALVNNTGIGAGDTIYAGGLATSTEFCDQVVALRARGVTVILVDEGQEDPCGGFLEGEGEGPAEGEGSAEGEGEGPAEGEGEGGGLGPHSADQNQDNRINLTELLRVIQFFNSGGLYCVTPPATSEDGYLPGQGENKTCAPHSSDYNPQNWAISLTELLRLIQFFNSGGYYECPGQNTEDGYCPGQQIL